VDTADVAGEVAAGAAGADDHEIMAATRAATRGRTRRQRALRCIRDLLLGGEIRTVTRRDSGILAATGWPQAGCSYVPDLLAPIEWKVS
jgi:hypothetical protein